MVRSKKQKPKQQEQVREPRKKPVLVSHGMKPVQYIIPALLVVLVAVGFARTFIGVWTFDDDVNILQNQRIQDWDRLFAHFPRGMGRRPLVELSLAIDYERAQKRMQDQMEATEQLSNHLDKRWYDRHPEVPYEYHETNLLLHILVTLAVFGVLRRTLLLERFSEDVRRAAPYLAGTIALLWGLHPLHTQTVSYVIQRAESMMGLMYVLCMYLLIRGAQWKREVEDARLAKQSKIDLSFLFYGLCILAAYMGMMAKAVMVTVPVALIVYDRVFLAGDWRSLVLRRWWLHVGVATSWSMLLVNRVAQGVLDPTIGATKSATVGFGYKEVTPLEYLLTQAGVILHYIRLTIFPYPQCLDNGWKFVQPQDVMRWLPPGLIVLALLAGTVYLLIKRHWIGYLGAWFFVILTPTSSIVPIRDAVYEHRVYLSSAAIIALAVAGGYWLYRYAIRSGMLKPDIARVAAAVLIVGTAGAYAARSYVRMEVYANGTKMWADVVATYPDHARGHYNYGLNLAAEANRKKFKVDKLRKSIRDGKMAGNEKAAAEKQIEHLLRERQELLTRAKAHYAEAIRLKRAEGKIHVMAHNNLGMEIGKEAMKLRKKANLLRRQNKPEEAAKLDQQAYDKFSESIEHFERVVKANNQHEKAWNNLALSRFHTKRYEQSLEAYRHSLSIRPAPDTYSNMAILLEAMFREARQKGEAEKASDYARKAAEALQTYITMRPRNLAARVRLARIFHYLRKYHESVEQYHYVLERQPAAVTYFNLGLAYEDMSHAAGFDPAISKKKAIEAYEQALSMNPQLQQAEARINRLRSQ